MLYLVYSWLGESTLCMCCAVIHPCMCCGGGNATLYMFSGVEYPHLFCGGGNPPLCFLGVNPPPHVLSGGILPLYLLGGGFHYPPKYSPRSSRPRTTRDGKYSSIVDYFEFFCYVQSRFFKYFNNFHPLSDTSASNPILSMFMIKF